MIILMVITKQIKVNLIHNILSVQFAYMGWVSVAPHPSCDIKHITPRFAAASDRRGHVILVLPRRWLSRWHDLCSLAHPQSSVSYNVRSVLQRTQQTVYLLSTCPGTALLPGPWGRHVQQCGYCLLLHSPSCVSYNTTPVILQGISPSTAFCQDRGYHVQQCGLNLLLLRAHKWAENSPCIVFLTVLEYLLNLWSKSLSVAF